MTLKLKVKSRWQPLWVTSLNNGKKTHTQEGRYQLHISVLLLKYKHVYIHMIIYVKESRGTHVCAHRHDAREQWSHCHTWLFQTVFLSNHDPQVTLPLCGSQKAPPSYKEGVVWYICDLEIKTAWTLSSHSSDNFWIKTCLERNQEFLEKGFNFVIDVLDSG